MSSKIETFLDSYPPTVTSLSKRLRILVKEAAPECTETLHNGWKVISYGYSTKFCAIAPHSKWVNLQFHSGTALADDDGLLAGSGKAMRHVKVAAEADLGESLRALIREAARLGR